MVKVERNEIATRVIVCLVTVILLFAMIFIGNRSSGAQNINTNENTVTIKEDKDDIRKVNINEASQAELESLPGVGKEKAKSIIEHRPYASPWDLVEVNGIGEKTVLGLLDYIET